ncbi:hypothetical protein SDC9_101541 [bioreactor metagenome]|jgi:acyl carrier protein|uniref:Acyl carrier protein n=1 Tax=bioreactor metagenome TaxID=1076179 RepID=A0A645AR14_9ZZZZ
MNHVDPELLNQLRQLLVEITGNDPEEVQMSAHLEDDLGMNLDEDLPRLVDRINAEFDIELDSKVVFEELNDAGETVASLLQLIRDELELG